MRPKNPLKFEGVESLKFAFVSNLTILLPRQAGDSSVAFSSLANDGVGFGFFDIFRFHKQLHLKAKFKFVLVESAFYFYLHYQSRRLSWL